MRRHSILGLASGMIALALTASALVHPAFAQNAPAQMASPESRWFLFGAAAARQPINDMNRSFGVGPSLAYGVGYRMPGLTMRGSLGYSALRCDAADSLGNDLSGVVHQASFVMDGLLPEAFGISRSYLIGGVGVAVRRLHEGRIIVRPGRNEWGRPDLLTRYMGYDDPFVDAVVRVGAGYRLFDGGRWRLNVELLAETDVSVWGDSEIDLDLRVDESVQAGLSLQVDL